MLKFRPDLIDYNKLNKGTPDQNLNNAFNVADEKLGLARLLDPEGILLIYSIILYDDGCKFFNIIMMPDPEGK